MKYLFSWLAILLTAVIVNAVSAAAPKDYELRKQARPLIAQQRYDEAVKVYVDASELMTDDDQMQAYCMTQAMLITLRNIKNEEAAFKLASQIRDPKLAASQRLYLLEQTKQYKELLEAFGDTDFSDWPLDVQMQSYASRAEALRETGQNDKVEADLSKASQTPGATSVRLWACFELGQYYEKEKKDIDKAVAAYELAMSITPAHYAWRIHCFQARARIMLERNQGAQLIEDYKKFDFNKVSNISARAQLYVTLADAHISQKNVGQAANILTTVLRLPDISSSMKKYVQDKLDNLANQMQRNQ